MTRSLSSTLSTTISQPVYRPVYLVKLEFDGGIERAATTPFSIWFDDTGGGVKNEFIGVGSLGSISNLDEGAELRSYGASVGLSGVDPAHLAEALNSKYQGRPATIWLGFLDADWALIDTPVLVQRYFMDTMPIQIGKQGSITVNLENMMSRWDTQDPENARYTSADQQSRYPGDLGLEFTSASAVRELIWGRS